MVTCSFRTWLEEYVAYERENGDHIKVNLPSVRQSHNFDCGAAALRAVCEYFKVGPEKEADFIKACKTKKKHGTRPTDIVRAAHLFGLNVKPISGMSIDDLKSYLDLKRPIICCIQAYGEKKDYKERMSGHYVVAIGYDNIGVYFEDPSMTDARGYLPYKDFKKRWRDQDADGNHYTRYGMVIWKPSGEETDREYVPQAKKIP